MLKRSLISLLTLAAVAAATPAVAGAADTVLVPSVEAQRMTALDGTLVWVSGAFPNQTLMQRSSDGTVAPVAGAPTATYRSVDLGHDGSSRLVLTYVRCTGTKNCKAYSDNLAGTRNTYKKLVPTRCELTSAPSRWGSRVAYGLSCDKLRGKPNVHDRTRSGLFVRKGSAAAKRLRLPKDAVKFGVDFVNWVDLRGTKVGAVASDIYSYAFSQSVNANALSSRFIAGSEGESDEHVVGMSLGSGGALWTLVDALHVGDPNQARITRLVGGNCDETETLSNATLDDDSYRYTALAVDGTTLMLNAPTIGIVTHPFAPSTTC
jgi:hypothetical protein